MRATLATVEDTMRAMGLEPNAWQRRALYLIERDGEGIDEPVHLGGDRGCGASMLAVALAVHEAATVPGATVLAMAPTPGQVKLTLIDRATTRASRAGIGFEFRHATDTMTFPDGSSILFRAATADHARLEGLRPRLLVADDYLSFGGPAWLPRGERTVMFSTR